MYVSIDNWRLPNNFSPLLLQAGVGIRGEGYFFDVVGALVGYRDGILSLALNTGKMEYFRTFFDHLRIGVSLIHFLLPAISLQFYY